MRYYYRDLAGRKLGPFTAAELEALLRSGVIGLDTDLIPEDGFEPVKLRVMSVGLGWAAGPAPPGTPSEETPPPRGPAPPPLQTEPTGPQARETLADRARADLRALIPHLLMPFEELRGGRWLRNRRFLVLASVGLVPLVLIMLLAGRGDIRAAYWAIALYFSVLWGFFFHALFPAPGVRLSTCVGCFFATGFFSVTLLLLAYSLPPLVWVGRIIQSGHLMPSLLAFVFGVGVPEEACKALTLVIVARQLGPLPPQAMVFYGLMSGLGLGIYEGVAYQLGRNVAFSSGAGEYYLLNMLRLTTLPFLHAIWTGIAGYFIGFACQFPKRRVGLGIVAIGLPALLHGLYNAFSGSVLGLVFALLAVLVLNLYQVRSMDFEQGLR